MSAVARFERALASADYAAVVREIPYADYLGLVIEPDGDARRYRLPFREDLVGNTQLPALHGGVVAGFLELSAQLEALITQQQRRIPGPIDFAIDYLRSAGPRDSFVTCKLVRQGSRVAQVQAECFQDDPGKPVAFVRAVFLLQDVADAAAE